MTAQEYLEQLVLMQEVVYEKEAFLKELKRRTTSLNSQNLQSPKVSGGYLSNEKGFSELIAKVSLAEEDLNKTMKEYFNLRAEIVSKIHKLKKLTYVKFLYKRHVEFKTLNVIAEEIHISYEYARQLPKKSLKEFEKVHEDFLKNYKE